MDGPSRTGVQHVRAQVLSESLSLQLVYWISLLHMYATLWSYGEKEFCLRLGYQYFVVRELLKELRANPSEGELPSRKAVIRKQLHQQVLTLIHASLQAPPHRSVM